MAYNWHNITPIHNREEMRKWLQQHEDGELFIPVNRSKTPKPGVINYVDAVCEALCWGWIDSTLRNVDGRLIQRFSPRQAKSHWTTLNLQRVELESASGRMTERGRKVIPLKQKE